jgi:hypothetical protein
MIITKSNTIRQRRSGGRKLSLRKSINAYCRECTYDPLDQGGPSHQIAACISDDCPLHPVRPITCTTLPLRLLDAWGVHPEQLDDRARALVAESDLASVEGQIDQPQSTEKAFR